MGERGVTGASRGRTGIDRGSAGAWGMTTSQKTCWRDRRAQAVCMGGSVILSGARSARRQELRLVNTQIPHAERKGLRDNDDQTLTTTMTIPRALEAVQ